MGFYNYVPFILGKKVKKKIWGAFEMTMRNHNAP